MNNGWKGSNWNEDMEDKVLMSVLIKTIEEVVIDEC